MDSLIAKSRPQPHGQLHVNGCLFQHHGQLHGERLTDTAPWTATRTMDSYTVTGQRLQHHGQLHGERPACYSTMDSYTVNGLPVTAPWTATRTMDSYTVTG
ncbi:unnamed protein product [Boreogadus saida]